MSHVDIWKREAGRSWVSLKDPKDAGGVSEEGLVKLEGRQRPDLLGYRRPWEREWTASVDSPKLLGGQGPGREIEFMKDFPFYLGPRARKAPLCGGWVAHSG